MQTIKIWFIYTSVMLFFFLERADVMGEVFSYWKNIALGSSARFVFFLNVTGFENIDFLRLNKTLIPTTKPTYFLHRISFFWNVN